MYKQTVEQIKNLKWGELSVEELQTLMVLSWYAAKEFSKSLRIALKLYPEDKGLLEMSKGELKTDNLHFADYKGKGDHSDFLRHFIKKYALDHSYPEAKEAGRRYTEKIMALPDDLRAMSIVSRESELSGIFERILKAKVWSTPALKAFRYYLETHIQLDSMEGGHADLLSGFKVTADVNLFYKARINLYFHCLPTLFK